jgi:exodeoxyribonuclease III
MRIATWNVNGIRARAQELCDWLATDQPDVVCLQEIKASPEQVPALLLGLDDYWCHWHGAGGYSGVALLVRKSVSPEPPVVSHPDFDVETRISVAPVAGVTVASVYVPNGGKDFETKMRFLEAMRTWVAMSTAHGEPLVLCGDLNVARAEIDVHPKERKPNGIGQRPDERAEFARLLDTGLVDVGRALDPINDGLFTWWAPWRNLRQRNIGWRIDYVLASDAFAARAKACVVRATVGRSDHAPVVAEFT